ncbi:MAG TPA: DUF6311 domain-containing protein [Vicinamibacterales bacterium]|nr:DUF6311 domain-containing protein [Vicinamibacterales bacterium]
MRRLLPSSATTFMPPLVAALLGAGLFAWIAGWRVLSPTSVDWVLKLDWQHHFMGWHFFRNDPWSWPPGLISSYYAPVGTAIGFTDSIPLMAIPLKLLDTSLPTPLQYLGVWLLLCFAAQGAMGVLLTGLWTPSPILRVLGGALFVVVPTLLGRVGHPALASHWLLLWALLLYFRDWRTPGGVPNFAALGLVAGLIHPYLAVMVFAIVAAITARRLFVDLPVIRRLWTAAQPLLALSAGLFAGWWCAGLLSLSGSDDLTSTGLDLYSMNLLGPVASAGWSRFLPQFAVASQLQDFEGFQYLGLGLLILIPLATMMGIARRRLPWRQIAPLMLVTVAMAIYALSPRVMLGPDTILDYSTPALDRLAIFRATGRFFWPATYMLVSLALWSVVTRLRTPIAAATLAAALTVQVADVSQHWVTLRATAHSDEFHTWPQTMPSHVWQGMLPHYRHIIFYPPEQCGPAPVPFLHAAVLAGTYGLSVNTGHLARRDRAASARHCAQIGKDFNAGLVRDDTVYLLNRDLVARFRENAARPVVCAELDGIQTCVTESSYQRWSSLAEFR